MNYSEAYGVNDLSHVVGNSAIGSFIHGFLWRSGQMTDLGALSGQVASEARAINNTGLIAGKSNIFPVVWEYDIANPGPAPRIQQNKTCPATSRYAARKSQPVYLGTGEVRYRISYHSGCFRQPTMMSA